MGHTMILSDQRREALGASLTVTTSCRTGRCIANGGIREFVMASRIALRSKVHSTLLYISCFPLRRYNALK